MDARAKRRQRLELTLMGLRALKRRLWRLNRRLDAAMLEREVRSHDGKVESSLSLYPPRGGVAEGTKPGLDYYDVSDYKRW